MADPYLGQIIPFAGNFAIRGWAECDGQLLAISSYSALFSILGTMYGGDGRTTFGLPDLRGRACIHQGQGPGLSSYAVGERGGQETVTLTQNQIPSHSHASTLHATTAASTASAPGTALRLGAVSEAGLPPVPDAKIYSGAANNTTLASDSISGGNTGGSQNHTNMQPYLAVTWLIAVQGVFPSRN